MCLTVFGIHGQMLGVRDCLDKGARMRDLDPPSRSRSIEMQEIED